MRRLKHSLLEAYGFEVKIQYMMWDRIWMAYQASKQRPDDVLLTGLTIMTPEGTTTGSMTRDDTLIPDRG